MTIDAHVHVWHRGDGHSVLIRERWPALNEDFTFERLVPHLEGARIEQVVLVSAAQSFAETQRLLDVADRFPGLVAGVVGFLDIHAPDFEDALQRACAHPAFAGLRFPLVVFPDPDWIRHPRVGLALRLLSTRGLVAQILARPKHLTACADVLSDHAAVKAVIDHAGNPGPAAALDPEWREGLAALGQETNALCKVGEFSLPMGPLADQARCDAILAHAIGSFGADRLIYGSNWPVSAIRQVYPAVLSRLLETACRIGVDPDQLERSMSMNAVSLFPRSVGR